MQSGAAAKSRINKLAAVLLFTIFVIFLVNSSQKSQKQTAAFNFGKNNYLEFAKYIKLNGSQVAYSALKSNFANNETAAHDFAHVVGEISYEQNGLSGLSICDTSYNYGCYHGFIETFLAKEGIKKVDKIQEACLALGNVHAPSCLHGIGHGIMVNASYKLDQALGDCDRLKEEARIYCYDGTFMEKISGSMITGDKPVQSEQTIMEPCQNIKEPYKNQCWRNQVSLWFAYYDANTQNIGEKCYQIEEKYQQTCLMSMGNQIAMIAKTERGKVIALCTIYNIVSDYCLFGAMDELMFEGKPPELSQSLCEQAHDKEVCGQKYQKLLGDFNIRFKKN